MPLISETMQRHIDGLRAVMRRGNGDLAHMAPVYLDALEGEVERVAGLEGAAVLNFDDTPYVKPGERMEVANG